MTIITAEQVIARSAEFCQIATIDALELIAKKNGRTADEAAAAFAAGNEKVRQMVAGLVFAAAQTMADTINNGAA